MKTLIDNATNKAVNAKATKAKNNIVINALPEKTQSLLDNQYLEYAEQSVRAYGMSEVIAVSLNQVFAFDWFTMTKGVKSEQGLMVEAQRVRFADIQKARGVTNPARNWQLIKQQAEKAKYPERFLKGEVDADGIEQVAQGEKGAEGAERSPAVRYVEELTRLWKFGARQEDMDKKSLDTHKALGKLLSDTWGINLATIEK
jgi:hypothetical protein